MKGIGLGDLATATLPKTLRTRVLRLLGPMTIIYKAVGLF